MRFGKHIHGPQRMNEFDCLTFHLEPPSGQNSNLSDALVYDSACLLNLVLISKY